eukprot:COSAG01_NODE_17984_length_1108_cov_2.178394_2_plen_115_part_00
MGGRWVLLAQEFAFAKAGAKMAHFGAAQFAIVTFRQPSEVESLLKMTGDPDATLLAMPVGPSAATVASASLDKKVELAADIASQWLTLSSDPRRQTIQVRLFSRPAAVHCAPLM